MTASLGTRDTRPSSVSSMNALPQGLTRPGLPPGTAGPDHAGVREGRRHAVVLEAAGRVHPLILEQKSARLQTDVGGHGLGALHDCLAFADGQHLLRRRERQQLAEAPYAAEAQWL